MQAPTHRPVRSALRALAPAIASSALLVLGACASAGSAEPTARSILDRHVKETRTDRMIADTSSTKMQGKIEFGSMGLEGELEAYSAKPDLVFTSFTLGAMGTTREGYDGKVGWMSSPMIGTSIMEGLELLALKMRADYDHALLKSEDYAEIELVGREPFEGVDCHKIRTVYRAPDDPALAEESLAARTTTMWFDAKTGLLLASTVVAPSPQGQMEVTSVLSDYKEFGDGYLIPTRTVQRMMGGIEIVTTIDSMEFDGVDPSVFALPEEVRALL